MNYLLNTPEKLEINAIKFISQVAEENEQLTIIPNVSSATAFKTFNETKFKDFVKMGTSFPFLYLQAEEVQSNTNFKTYPPVREI